MLVFFNSMNVYQMSNFPVALRPSYSEAKNKENK